VGRFFIPEQFIVIATLVTRTAVAVGFFPPPAPRTLRYPLCPALARTLPRRACAIGSPQIFDASQLP